MHDRVRLTIGHVLRHAPAASAAGADAATIDIAQDLLLRKLSNDGVLDMLAFKGARRSASCSRARVAASRPTSTSPSRT